MAFCESYNEKNDIKIHMENYHMMENITSIGVKRERVKQSYNEDDYEIYDYDKAMLLSQIKKNHKKNISCIYENQHQIGRKVQDVFKDRKVINVMVIAKTQSGKTGSMCSSLQHYFEDQDNIIHLENIYIITALSSCEWIQQTKDRLPDCLKNRVYHRSDLLTKFLDDIKGKKNVLIIMDEIHIAARQHQTIHNAFQRIGLLNINYLYDNDIKILEYTATPDGTIYDLMKWGEASSKILAEPGEGYIGCYDLLMESRVKQYKDLCGFDKKAKECNPDVLNNLVELKETIEKTYNMPMWHIIRVHTSRGQNDITMNNFKKVFGDDEYEYMRYDMKSNESDINNILVNKPRKHTFIFIKEMLRCAKTIEHKRYKGISYERYSTNTDDSTIIQGLVGRDTGYNTNPLSICYTNIDSIERYEKLWNSGFEDRSINWYSKTTKTSRLNGNNTFNDYAYYDDTDTSSEVSDVIDEIEPKIVKLQSQEEAKNYCKNILRNKRGPNKKTPNAKGFYETTLRNKKNVILSTEDCYRERKCNITNGAKYALRPCYRDKNDKDTLEWWLIYYENQ